MRKLRSILARVLIAGLIGAVVTVGVAIGCGMARLDPPTSRPRLSFYKQPDGMGHVSWRAEAQSWYGRVGLLTYDGEDYFPRLRAWDKDSAPVPLGAVPPKPAAGRRLVRIAGWPNECVWGAIEVPLGYQGGYPIAGLVPVGAIRAGRTLDYDDCYGVAGYLPTVPIWSGLAANTLFFGTIAWALMFFSGTLRRWRWRRLGRCVRCGYSLAGIAGGAVCPECGGESTKYQGRSTTGKPG